MPTWNDHAAAVFAARLEEDAEAFSIAYDRACDFVRDNAGRDGFILMDSTTANPYRNFAEQVDRAVGGGCGTIVVAVERGVVRLLVFEVDPSGVVVASDVLDSVVANPVPVDGDVSTAVVDALVGLLALA